MTDTQTDNETRFCTLADRICDHAIESSPSFATYLGIHDFDHHLNTLSRNQLEDSQRTESGLLSELTTIDRTKLCLDSRIDLELLESFLNLQHLDFTKIQSWRKNPMVYCHHFSEGIFGLIRRNFAPLDQRFKSIVQREKFIPEIFQSARENLENPHPYLTEKALELTQGSRILFDTVLPKLALELTDSGLRTEFMKQNEHVKKELNRYIRFLEEKLMPASKGNYQLGEHLFSRLLSLTEHVDIPLIKLKKAGRDELKRIQNQFIETSARMDSSNSPLENMEAVLNDYLPSGDLLPYTASLLDTIRLFIDENDILTLPRDINCSVEPMPPFMWGFAAMNTPGEFEMHSMESFYYVEPVRDEWPEEQKIEHLKAMNRWSMESISIHEAYPGHFIQGVFSRNSGSRVRKIFQSSGAHEGWAHYCEEMMVESGYGNNDPRFLMAYLRECLIRICRYHTAIGLHTGEMTIDDGISFFEREGYMDSYTAKAETYRGIYDPMYLVYSLGKLMLLKLRTDYREQNAETFSLKKFHHSYLNVGPIMLPLARQLILKKGDSDAV